MPRSLSHSVYELSTSIKLVDTLPAISPLSQLSSMASFLNRNNSQKSQCPKTSIHFSVHDQSSKKPYRGLLSRRSLAQKFSLLDTVIVQDTRERQRQRSVNQAFGELRLLLPTYPPDKKLSKHEILRSSIKYIHVLESILKYQEEVDGLPPAAMSTPELQKRTHLCRDRTKQLRTMSTFKSISRMFPSVDVLPCDPSPFAFQKQESHQLDDSTV
ncbi:T-cell acute lymphocytic leukemia protein [Clonorchis sinensis]|uniref:T-cell acute lymphocytic leukemia protein n=1 Tax=Clonorchis sinensis TaxID=79923 RepID=G7YS91_CLOSI|nr:T-cell acute lymphocytic leukemia protein [Clonorchis sinensis]